MRFWGERTGSQVSPTRRVRADHLDPARDGAEEPSAGAGRAARLVGEFQERPLFPTDVLSGLVQQALP
jgi:hypothetical protein